MIAMILCAAASATLIYVVVGYPLLLGFIASRWPQPVQSSASHQPDISIIIPAYNGELYLAGKLRSVLALDYPREKMEVIVVSDGSTDLTDEIARSFADQGVLLIRQERGGKPAALNTAVPTARGEIVVLTDVRQELEANSVALLVESFADPSVGTVSGELVIRKGNSQAESDIGLYWRFESWIRDQLSSIDSMFGATGPFYAMRRSLVVRIPPDTLLDDMYLPISAFFRGFRLIVDKRAKAYDFPTSRETEFRRKVRTLAGNYQLLFFYPRLLLPANRMWLHYMSYKIGRLLLPWCLLVIAATTWWIPEPLRIILLAGQFSLYGLAGLDPAIGPRSPFKRLSSPLRTFVTMMVAAVQGLSVFFVPARSLWKVTSASQGKGI